MPTPETDSRQRLQPWGVAAGISLMAACLAAASASRGYGVGVACGAATGLWAVTDRRTLRLALGRPFLVFAAVIALAAFVANPNDMRQAGLSACVMLGRSWTVLLGVAAFSASASAEELAYLGARVGFKGLGFALGVAANSVTRSMADMREAWRTLRMRRGRRLGIRDWRRLALTILARTVTRADETATAAEARGLDPAALDGSPIRVSRRDVVVAAAAWAAAAGAIAVDVLTRS